jgi:hypothetical protein
MPTPGRRLDGYHASGVWSLAEHDRELHVASRIMIAAT